MAAITGLDHFGFQPNVSLPELAEGSPLSFQPLSSSPNGLFFEGQCFRPPETDTFRSPRTVAAYTGNRYGGNITSILRHLAPCGYQPSEMQAAYGLLPLYEAGLNASGQTIVITDAYRLRAIAGDAQTFAEVYNLPPVNLQIAKAPGINNNPFGTLLNWELETTLDVEWAHAMAPGANIMLVLATDRASLDEAVNYAVVHHLGNTISNSWGRSEGFGKFSAI